MLSENFPWDLICVSVVLTNLNGSALGSAATEVISKHAFSSNIDSACYQQQQYHTLTTSQCCATTEFLHRLLQQKFSNSTVHHAPLAIHIRRWAWIFQSVATRYGLSGPGIECRWEGDFPHSSWTVLGTIQPPVHWVPGFFSGGKGARRWCWPPTPTAEVKERVQLYLYCSIWAFAASSSSSSSVICQTIGPKPLPKWFLHTVRSRASSFNWQYPLLSLRSSSSFLRLLPRLLVTSICPFIFPSVTCCRRQFLLWGDYLLFYFNCTPLHVKSLSQQRQNVLPTRNFPDSPTLLQSTEPQIWVLKCNKIHLINTMVVSVWTVCSSEARFEDGMSWIHICNVTGLSFLSSRQITCVFRKRCGVS